MGVRSRNLSFRKEEGTLKYRPFLIKKSERENVAFVERVMFWRIVVVRIYERAGNACVALLLSVTCPPH